MAPEQLLDNTSQTDAGATANAPTPSAKDSEKSVVEAYFNSTGFDRWNRIYSDSEDVNKVQRNIRIGHQKTVDQVLAWLQEEGNLAQRSFCDAGCGVGSLSLPLAALGAGSIQASDLSAAMVNEASRRASEQGLDPARLQFSASDLESLEGRYDTVICLDVFIHYPQEPAEQMVEHLASLAERRLLVSFAPTRRCWRCSSASASCSPAPARPPGPTPCAKAASWRRRNAAAFAWCAAASTRPRSISPA